MFSLNKSFDALIKQISIFYSFKLSPSIFYSFKLSPKTMNFLAIKKAVDEPPI